MKYWKDTEVEYLQYSECGRISPFGHPAAISIGDGIRTEVEIIPNTSEMRDYLSPDTFEKTMTLCVQVEARRWRDGYEMQKIVQWVTLEGLGYDKEPDNYLAFDEAMEIL